MAKLVSTLRPQPEIADTAGERADARPSPAAALFGSLLLLVLIGGAIMSIMSAYNFAPRP